ncbi:MAG: purine-nucleoside phosphorylase [Actinomycetaceae bacterium]|nr:purine-nucleoside phosphorylase [Actinomycetaceae bacterium]MDY6083066.1 purine-nucleoside phosphorylase [Actinomycetaceae bacterium]
MSQRSEALDLCFAYDPAGLRSVMDAATDIAARTGCESHQLLIVLGSGYASVARSLGSRVASIPLGSLSGVPVPSAEGHGQELLSIQMPTPHGDVRALVATGRSHMYEGLTPSEVVQLCRIGAATGIEAAVLTNAGGCLSDWELGDLMVIDDHVNLTGISPFTGAVFTDIWNLWDQELSDILAQHARRRGTYAFLRGPEYQTRRESELMRAAGLNMVGMSTVLEALALHQLGVRVAGISIVSDLSFSSSPTEHDLVLDAVNRALGSVKEALLAVADHVAGSALAC